MRRLAMLALLALLAAPARGQEAAPEPRAANEALVTRYVQEVLAAGKLDRLGELVADDYADLSPGADPGAGPPAVRAAQTRIRKLFQDLEYTVDELLTDGDRVVARYTVHATKKPAAGAAPAPPQRVEVAGLTVFHLAGGKIRSTWTINDQLAMFRQLGYRCEPPGGPGR